MATDPRRASAHVGREERGLGVGDVVVLELPEADVQSGGQHPQVSVVVRSISGHATRSLRPDALRLTGHNNSPITDDSTTPVKVGDVVTFVGPDSMVQAEVRNLHGSKIQAKHLLDPWVVGWSDATASEATGLVRPRPNPKRTREARARSKASSVPSGKVKASFNLFQGDMDSLRGLAKLFGTTVTNVLQRAIRDECFIQEQLDHGNKFAIIDKEGEVREIIWR